MVMKETTGMLQDDVRLVAARGKLLKDAIIKCYDSSFGPIPVQNIVKEELYEIRNLNIGQTGPEISLPSTAAAGKVTLPSGNKPVLVVFGIRRICVPFSFAKAASLRKEFPGLTVMPVAPGKRENIEKALLNLKMDMPSLVDEKAVAFKDYRVRLTPRVYLLDPAGKILMRGTPDMLFDANLYAVMGKLEGKRKKSRMGKSLPPPLLPPSLFLRRPGLIPRIRAFPLFPGLIGRGPRSLPPPPVRRTILFPLLL